MKIEGWLWAGKRGHGQSQTSMDLMDRADGAGERAQPRLGLERNWARSRE